MGTIEDRWDFVTRYDIVECDFVTEVIPKPQLPITGLPRIIKHAQLMGVDPRDAISARLRYLKDYPDQKEAQQLLNWMNGTSSSGAVAFDELKDVAHNVDVRVVLDYAGISYKSSGLLRCPFHEDKNESASVAKSVLVCFAGCKPMSSNRNFFDAVAVYRELFNVSYKEAVQEVANL